MNEIKTPILMVLSGLMLISSCAAERATNPIIRHMYTADPSAHVWADGRLYLYPSTDVAPPVGCDRMDGYHIFSTDDMVTWTDHGEILHSRDVEWGRPEGGFMWAPDCAYKDGTYYYYFPHPCDTKWNDSWKIGVATSQSPTADFEVQGYLTNALPYIDPCVFVDDDEQAYFYQGGSARAFGGKLKGSMVEIEEGTLVEMQGLDDFHEGAFVFKRKGVYYMIYPDNVEAGIKTGNQMRYAVSKNPLGPWTSKGIFIDSTGSHTMHGSVVEFKGQWYAFYHNKALSGMGNLRSVCVDPLYFNEDGTIQKVIQTGDTMVIAQLPPADATRYEAEDGVVGDGQEKFPHGEASNDAAVNNFHLAGSFVEFSQIDGGNGGPVDMTIVYASDSGSGVGVDVNDVEITWIPCRGGKGWDTFTTAAMQRITLKPGVNNTIKLRGGSGGINVDYIAITPAL